MVYLLDHGLIETVQDELEDAICTRLFLCGKNGALLYDTSAV